MPQHLPEGFLLFNRTYRIERVLGQGGFGITYLATDLNLERVVAIKEFFPKDYCNRDEATRQMTVGAPTQGNLIRRLREKFLKEARKIAQFDYPGIIRIHTAFEENDTAYYVMELIEGESLAELVKNHGPLSVSQATQYITQVGDALTYLHQRNVNHLDVKPANIMLRKRDNRAILIDFGLSKQYDESGQQTSTTPTGISHGFAPLEQYHQGGVSKFSAAADLYSLAATYYFLLTGTVPPSAVELATRQLDFPPGIPDKIKAAITQAMQSRVSARHESVDQFVRQINGDTRRATKTGQKTKTLKSATDSESSGKKSGWNVGVLFLCLAFFILIPLYCVLRDDSKVDDKPVSLIQDPADTDSSDQPETSDVAETSKTDKPIDELPLVNSDDDEEEITDEVSPVDLVCISDPVYINGTEYHFFKGVFTNDEETNPVMLAFPVVGNDISGDVIYKNVNLGGRIRMTGGANSQGEISLTGKDGNYDFILYFDDVQNSKLVGTSDIGPHHHKVILSPTTETFDINFNK